MVHRADIMAATPAQEHTTARGVVSPHPLAPRSRRDVAPMAADGGDGVRGGSRTPIQRRRRRRIGNTALARRTRASRVIRVLGTVATAASLFLLLPGRLSLSLTSLSRPVVRVQRSSASRGSRTGFLRTSRTFERTRRTFMVGTNFGGPGLLARVGLHARVLDLRAELDGRRLEGGSGKVGRRPSTISQACLAGPCTIFSCRRRA